MTERTVMVHGSLFTHDGPGPYTMEAFRSGYAVVLDAHGINRIRVLDKPGAVLLPPLIAEEVTKALNEMEGGGVTERAYTVAELDALRRACEDRLVWGSSYQDEFDGTILGRSFSPGEKAMAVEEMVRTHMMAGHTAEDLVAADKEKWEAA